MTVQALRSTAQRIQLLAAEAAGLRAELERLVASKAATPGSSSLGCTPTPPPGCPRPSAAG